MGVPRQRIHEAFNTVDVDRFARGAAHVRALNAPSAGHRFLYVGVLIERKNVAALLRAFAQIRDLDDTLTVVGTGPLADSLRALAAELALSGRVRFAGSLEGDELVAAYGTSDTLVLPSTSEVWGLVVNEALAAGLNTVVSDTAGVTPDIVGMPGVFPAAPTVAGLASAMTASRQSWTGPRDDHPVMAHTPRALAEVISSMVNKGRRD
jgi:glycosyltransferase involved in cell wall biosynthesis